MQLVENRECGQEVQNLTDSYQSKIKQVDRTISTNGRIAWTDLSGWGQCNATSITLHHCTLPKKVFRHCYQLPFMPKQQATLSKQHSNAFQWVGQPSKLPLRVRYLDPNLIHGSSSLSMSVCKRHLDRFSRFCRAQERDQQTDTQTDRPRYCI